MEVSTLLAAGLIFFSAAFMQGFSGFGAALIAVPSLCLVMDIHQAVPLSVVTSFFFGPYLAWKNRRQIDKSAAVPMIAAGMIAVPIGVTTLRRLDADHATLVLGIVMVTLVVGQNLLKFQFIGEHKPWKAAIAGWLAGLLAGAFNTAGPPLVVYLHLTTCAKKARATMYPVFVILGLNTLVNQTIHGMTTLDTLRMAVIAGPSAIIGAYFGGRIAENTPSDRFKRVVTVLIVLLGIYMVTKSLV